MHSDTIRAVNDLIDASGSNAKKAILSFYSDDEDFKTILFYALNPLYTYKMSMATLISCASTGVCRRGRKHFSSVFEVCETMRQKRSATDADVLDVQSFLYNDCREDEREIFVPLLAKTLRLGVTSTTVNKVFPGLIPEWDVQQAYPLDKYPFRDGEWFALTQKLNGVRATLYNGQLYARSGSPYEGLEHVLAAFDFEDAVGVVFDGELTLRDKGELSDNEAFREATGIINSDEPYKTQISYTVFDALPQSDFEKGESRATYRQRREYLNMISEELNKSGCVSVLPVLYEGTDKNRIDELLEQMVREDKEGLMVNLDVPYKCKRHRGILKVKRFYTMDLKIIGAEEGSGRLSGTLGALVLDYKGNEVRVGSGFSDEQRDDFWSRRDELTDYLCEVKYKEISSDKNTGAESLQFPVFVALRTDKSEVSYA